MTRKTCFLAALPVAVCLLGGAAAVHAQTTGLVTYSFTHVQSVLTQQYFDQEARYFRVIAPESEYAIRLVAGTNWPAGTPVTPPVTIKDLLIVQRVQALLPRFDTQVESCERMALIAQADPEGSILNLQLSLIDTSEVAVSGVTLTVFLSTGRLRCELIRN